MLICKVDISLLFNYNIIIKLNKYKKEGDDKMSKPKCKLIGEDGNIYNLLGLAGNALKQAGQREQSSEMLHRVTHEAKSYEDALCIIQDYVDVY